MLQLTRHLVGLFRPSSSLLAFLSVLIPVYTRSESFRLSFERAVPLLLISMCTFIVNDLDDIEKDRINHPERALPSGRIAPATATCIYYICLLSALLSTYFFIQPDSVAFLYYTLLTMCISYGYVVEFLPAFKPVYVSCLSTVPILILVAHYPAEANLFWIAAAIFAFNLGREMCKDILDRPGDPASPLHRVSSERMAFYAFSLQGTGIVLLSPLVRSPLQAVLVFIMLGLSAMSYIHWHWLCKPNRATALMKIIIFCGLIFLL